MEYFILVLKPELHVLRNEDGPIVFKSKVDLRIELAKHKDAIGYPIYNFLTLIENIKRANVPDYCVDSYGMYEKEFKEFWKEAQ